jgi:hypothetical protein
MERALGRAKPRRRSRQRLIEDEQKTWTEIVGICFHCHQTLLGDQPGGSPVRHLNSGLPYGWCAQALKEYGTVPNHADHDPDCPF